MYVCMYVCTVGTGGIAAKSFKKIKEKAPKAPKALRVANQSFKVRFIHSFHIMLPALPMACCAISTSSVGSASPMWCVCVYVCMSGV